MGARYSAWNGGEVPRPKNGAAAALALIAIVVIALAIYARYG